MASAARTANRVIAVTHGEIENTEDVEFKADLGTTSAGVTNGEWITVTHTCMHEHTHTHTHTHTAIAPMVTTAKGAITQSANAQAQETFGVKSDNV